MAAAQTNGKHGGGDVDRSKWPTTAEVCKTLGISRRTIHRLITDGDIAPSTNASGVRCFDPDAVEALRDVVSEANEVNTGDVVKMALQSAKDAQKELRELFELFHKPVVEVMQVLKEENVSLRAHNEKLHEEKLRVIDAIESLSTASHERDLKRLQTEHSEKRKDEVAEKFVSKLPELGRQLITGLTLKGEASKLLQSITDEQMQALKEIEFLSKEQLELLSKFRESTRAKPAAAATEPAPKIEEKGTE